MILKNFLLLSFLSFPAYAVEKFESLKEVSERFPQFIQLGDSNTIAGREELLGGEKDGHLFQSNYLERYAIRFDPGKDATDLNQNYASLKRDNGLEYEQKGKKVTFEQGVAHSDGKPCDYSLLVDFPRPLNYAMDVTGQLWVGYSIHSHIIGGVYALAEGEIVFDKCGKVEFISDRSGHYKPIPQQLVTALQLLNRQNALSSNLVVQNPYGDRLSHDQLQEFFKEPKDFPKVVSSKPFQLTSKDIPVLGDPDPHHISVFLKVQEVQKHIEKVNHFTASLAFMPFLQSDIDALNQNLPYPDIYPNVKDLLDLQQREATLISQKRFISKTEGDFYQSITSMMNGPLTHFKDKGPTQSKDEEMSLMTAMEDHLKMLQNAIREKILR